MSSIGSKSKVAKQERNIYTSNIRFTNPNQQAACTSLSVCYDTIIRHFGRAHHCKDDEQLPQPTT